MPVQPRTPITIVNDPDGTQTIHAGHALFDLPIAHAALLAWCKEVDLDPFQIPARDPITISPDRRTITTNYAVKDDRGGMLYDEKHRPRTKAHVVTLDHPAPPLPDQITQIAEVHQ